MKSLQWPKYSIIAIAIFLTWIKTYIVYQTSFDMKIENFMQQIILFINPLSFLMLIYGVSLFFKSTKNRNIYLVVTSVILASIVYANVAFYRFFSDFITLPVLFQTSNFGDLGTSALESIYFTDIFYFADVFILIAVIKFTQFAKQSFVIQANAKRAYFIISIAVLFLNLGLSETERPQLLTRSFDRELLVKNIGTYNYHLYDIYIQSKSHAQRVLADGSELVEINNYFRASHAAPNEELFGIAKGKNVIYISLESLQTFVINQEMNGEVITPFLNELTKDKDTFYFSNIYHNTGLGKTSDSEFIIENSLYGIGGGAVFFTNSGNTFNSLTEKLNDNGYFTSVMHANNKSFWNRDVMYKAMKTQRFYALEDYTVEEGQAVNWGLKDIPFFEQSVAHMKEMPKPFYSRLITLTNHYPFHLDEQDKFISEYTSESGTLNRYFQTVRYLDESIKVFFEQLKASGLYEDSIIVMYGDHYGISENHNEAMGQYLGKEITPFESAQLQRIPLFIHIPNSNKGKEMTNVGSQIDIRPTVLHLAGIDTSRDIQLGADLFSPKHEDFAIFRDGRFVTDKLVFAANTCYDKVTGEPTVEEACTPFSERAQQELAYSDQIIIGDLLRFYNSKSRNMILEQVTE